MLHGHVRIQGYNKKYQIRYLQEFNSLIIFLNMLFYLELIVYQILSPSSCLFLYHPSGRSHWGKPIWVKTAKDSTSIHYPLWDVIRECGELKSLITQVINPSTELDFTTTVGLIIISHIKDSPPVITPKIQIHHKLNLWPQPAGFIHITSSVLSLINQYVVWALAAL